MSTINERFKQLRKSLKLTQVELGERIALSQGHLTSIENGKREVTERTVKLLVQEFNINEHWLRTGEGEMKETGAADIFATFAAQHNLTPAEREVMRYCFFLPPADRAALLTHITNLADTIRAAENTERANTPAAKTQHTMTDDELEAEVEAYRAALVAEQKGQLASDSGNSAAKMA